MALKPVCIRRCRVRTVILRLYILQTSTQIFAAYVPTAVMALTGSSKKLAARARAVIPHGVNSPVRHYDPYPFFVSRAEGSHIYDAGGMRMLDLCNGYGALLLGHGHGDITGAVAEQLERGTLYCAPTEQEIMVSEMIRADYPSMEMSRMVNTGGEATMTAIRLARGHTGRSKIVMFAGGYHGAHDSVLVRSGSGSVSMSASAGSPPGVADHTIILQYNDTEGFADIIESRDDIAGVIMEPVMANMGLILPKKGFLEVVRHITIQRDIPLIFDEVVTGFRMSRGGAQSYYGIRPDMTTLAKALGCGFAAAAVGGRRDIMENLAPGGMVYQASTFAGNPVSAAAAIASMNAIRVRGERMYDNMERLCSMLASTVRDHAADHHIPCRIHNISSMMQIFFSDADVYDYDTARRADAARFAQLFNMLLKMGVFVAPSQFETVFLSAIHNNEDMDMVAGAYGHALEDMVRCIP